MTRCPSTVHRVLTQTGEALESAPARNFFPLSRDSEGLETEMRERLVGFRHPVHFVALLHRAAAAFSRFGKLTSQAQRHRLFATLFRSLAQPTHRQCHTTRRTHF